MRNFRNIFCLACLTIMIVFSGKIFAQDGTSAMNYSVPLMLNPGLTGAFDGDYRAGLSYRNEWAHIDADFSTACLMLEKNFNKRKDNTNSLGLLVFQDNAGGFYTTHASLSYSHEVVLSQKRVTNAIRGGFMAGVTNRRFDIKDFTFEEQFTGSGFSNSSANGEVLASQSRTLPAFQAGFVYYQKYAISDAPKLVPFGGVSVQNTIKLNTSFYSDGFQEQTTRFIAHGGALINATNELKLYPGIMMLNQNYDFLISGSLMAKYGFGKAEEEEKAVLAGATYRAGSGMSFAIGFQWSDFIAGAAYDISTSGISGSTTMYEAYEISLRYIIRNKKEAAARYDGTAASDGLSTGLFPFSPL
ncbi:MAG: PorP/SprF family type IX secretion system membrane protein [Bacteroidetes bacterium]|nr:PorP/SprF family type IX secretion system membrane protein [Bacteroidota bacterium]MBU1718521.1 PorP/SprF family type IX secretion system membrane protein [Bacteroidota bacterium]